MNANTFQQYSNTNANTCKKKSMNANANANTQICVFECIRMRIPNTNTPCLLPNVYTHLFPLMMVLSIVLHIYYPILPMKTVSCYNLFYSHFNYCMSSYYVYYCYFMSCCIYCLYNRGFQINNNNIIVRWNEWHVQFTHNYTAGAVVKR